MLLHQPLNTLLAHADALSAKFPPDPWPPIRSAVNGVYGTDMNDKCLRGQMPTPGDLQATNEVFVVA